MADRILNDCGCIAWLSNGIVKSVELCYSHSMDYCMDCEKHESEFDEYYMVHDDIWREAVFPFEWHMQLCINCLEERLGRVLKREDFTHVEVNDYIHSKQHSWRQQWRLGYFGV